MQLDDAHIFITGGSRGIGAGPAAAFRARGARVAITGRDEVAPQSSPDRSPHISSPPTRPVSTPGPT